MDGVLEQPEVVVHDLDKVLDWGTAGVFRDRAHDACFSPARPQRKAGDFVDVSLRGSQKATTVWLALRRLEEEVVEGSNEGRVQCRRRGLEFAHEASVGRLPLPRIGFRVAFLD